MRNHLGRTFAAGLASVFLLLVVAMTGCQPAFPGPDEEGGKGGHSVFFCFWNAENFFDDENNNRKGPGDKEYDPWYANHPDILKLKLAKLTEALLKMNKGNGPDIIALVEVESVRAGELLRDALNAKLPDKLAYTGVVMKELTAGRHIAPCIITRIPVVGGKTQLLGKHERILKATLKLDGKELVLIVAHFTSRLDGGEKRRADYGDVIYGTFRAMVTANPKVDVLVCGDFNDGPDDTSIVKHLRAVGDRQAVLRPGTEPKLFNLLADKDAKKYGTHYFNHWLIFDQIMVSPGMLDAEGWSCDADSVQPFNSLFRPGDKLKRPWRFGGPNEKGPRGYSDHFPMTMQLHVH